MNSKLKESIENSRRITEAELTRYIPCLEAECPTLAAAEEYMLSSGDFEQINELYKERDAIAQQLAEDFYSPEMEALNSSTTDKILDEYSGLPDEFREIGSAAALNLVLGLNVVS